MDKDYINTSGLYIRKEEFSDKWECGYMTQGKRVGNWVRHKVKVCPNYEEAEHWLNEQGKLSISPNKKVF